MKFAEHSELVGTHAFLSASTYHWIRYDDEKLEEYFFNSMEAARGTRLHEFAKEAILLKQRLADNGKTLNSYVNDAIGFRMSPEVILMYSYRIYGTVDAIVFDEATKTLRIHDLKTGKIKAKMDQLMVYVALFCLEYGYKPFELTIILRIYQNDEVEEYTPELEQIQHIIDKIVTFDRKLEELEAEVL